MGGSRRAGQYPPGGDGGSLVEVGFDAGIVDVGLVVPGEPGVDGLGQVLAVDREDGCLDGLVADLHRRLGDGPGLGAGLDGLDLGFPGVKPDDGDLGTGLVGALDGAGGDGLVGSREIGRASCRERV